FLDLPVARFDGYLAITTLHATERHHAVDFRNDSGIRWVTCFKKFGYPWQTTCDISGFTGRARDFGQDNAFFHGGFVVYRNVGTHRDVIGTDDRTFLIQDLDCRVLGFIPRIDNDFFAVAGLFVRLLAIGHAFDNRLELD